MIQLSAITRASFNVRVAALTIVLLPTAFGGQAGEAPDRQLDWDHAHVDGTAAEVKALVNDLRSDKVRFNAHAAIARLRDIGEPAVAALEAALDSRDYQQRQLAAHVLRRIDGHQPSNDMIGVTVEGLQHDTMPCGHLAQQPGGLRWDETLDRSYNYVFNATDGTRFLLQHAQLGEPYLIDGLNSADLQQRFLCAFILGYSGRTAATKQVAAVLLPHLRDNDIAGDARLATPALYRLGPPVLPDLYRALDDADDQQRNLIELIIYDITCPPANDNDLYERRDFNSITELCHDPAVSGRFIDVPDFKCPCCAGDD